MIYPELIQSHPTFAYTSQSWELTPAGLVLTFNYSLAPNIAFKHTITVADVTPQQLNQLPPEELERYVATIGLAEMLSYWKLAASPTIHIAACSLDQTQMDWWKKLLLKGMGEYFFVNQLPFTQPDFVTITTNQLQESQTLKHPRSQESSQFKVLVPLGGGKDSAVTLELLKQQAEVVVGTLMVNELPSAHAVASASGISTNQIVTRSFDPQLLELNTQGYLNGHVPVSASIASIGILVARLFGYTHVAIANERSSNEGNTSYLGEVINHQYSKTFEFESDFAVYSATYLPQDAPHYFSFLRPIYELQIASIFALFPQYHGVFRSCNKGQKTNTWCGTCPKCLFAYCILVPFLGWEETARHFGTDMFNNAELFPLAKELLGADPQKPFECVGTREETTVALHICVRKYQAKNQPLPPLLQAIQTKILAHKPDLDQRTQALFDSWNTEHLLPSLFTDSLERAYERARTTFSI